MRWPYKKKTVYDRIKKRFAFFPVVIDDKECVWLETYYKFTWEDYSGPNVKRFNTREEAVEWLSHWGVVD